MTWENRIKRHTVEDADQLLANPFNHRIHAKKQKDMQTGILDQVGWLQDVIVNEVTGHILDGHMRVELAIKHGEPVPVTWVDVEVEREPFVLAVFDKVGTYAGEDEDQLRAILDQIPDPDDPSLRALLDDLEAQVGDVGRASPPAYDEGGIDAPIEVSETPVAFRGAVGGMGKHTLVVAESLKGGSVKVLNALMHGKKADMVFMDPPYAIFGSSTGIASDIVDDKLVRPFFRKTLQQCEGILKPFGHVYVCCDWRSWASWWEEAKPTGLTVKNMIVWNKESGLGSMYANFHELLMFATFRPKRKAMTQKINGERTISGLGNVWTIKRAGQQEGGGQEREHNAQKPIALMATAMSKSTDQGDLVVDLFGGSGSTLFAAEHMGNQSITFEEDPVWADVTLRRWIRDMETQPELVGEASLDDTSGAIELYPKATTYEKIKKKREKEAAKA